MPTVGLQTVALKPTSQTRKGQSFLIVACFLVKTRSECERTTPRNAGMYLEGRVDECVAGACGGGAVPHDHGVEHLLDARARVAGEDGGHGEGEGGVDDMELAARLLPSGALAGGRTRLGVEEGALRHAEKTQASHVPAPASPPAHGQSVVLDPRPADRSQASPKVLVQIFVTGSRILGKAFFEAGRQAVKSAFSRLLSPSPPC